jgi:gluconate 2-dehydrogenase gamma chain
VSSVESPDDKAKLSRRNMLLGVIVLLGGAGALSRFTRRSAGDHASAGPALSAQHSQLLEMTADVMIPATETPGALAAGVPAFVRDMLEQWATPASRAEILGVLGDIDELAWERFGAAFVELQPERRLQLMRSFDEERISRQDPAYGKFKFLLLIGYYQSEIGATQELRYELIPGAWRGCVPFSEIDRASPI